VQTAVSLSPNHSTGTPTTCVKMLPTGKTITLDAKPSDAVEVTNLLIQATEGIPAEHIVSKLELTCPLQGGGASGGIEVEVG
jgi:hypothetical protein